MTYPISAIALFCDDIREEKSGAITLVGVLPDNIDIPPRPADVPPEAHILLPKLCIYVRLHFDPQMEIGEAKLRVIFPDGSVHDVSSLDSAALLRARDQTVVQNGPFVGVFSRIEMSTVRVTSYGRMKVEFVLDGKSYLCGALNFKPVEQSEAAKT